MLTFKDVLELVLLQGGPHDLLYGWDVFVQFDHQRVVVHALHIGNDGIIALLSQGDQVMEAMHPGLKFRQREGEGEGGEKGNEGKWWVTYRVVIILCPQSIRVE